ncbi:hypothetical protein B0H16DRAFT_1683206 [Mycena metata]|uniref:Uncharacterized protein n=1 Tax=Mycena metata TaxID=1033252 RepID=A0AAD7K9Z2_9AGAR|nr:hypothetical protein B0H16DRAFT_1683206 [Mycena metata]
MAVFGFRSKLFKVNILGLFSTKSKHLKINFTSNANVTELPIKSKVMSSAQKGEDLDVRGTSYCLSLVNWAVRGQFVGARHVEGPQFKLTECGPWQSTQPDRVSSNSLNPYWIRNFVSSGTKTQFGAEPEILFRILRLIVRLQPPDPDFDSDKLSTDSDSARGILRGDIRSEIPKWIGLDWARRFARLLDGRECRRMRPCKLLNDNPGLRTDMGGRVVRVGCGREKGVKVRREDRGCRAGEWRCGGDEHGHRGRGGAKPKPVRLRAYTNCSATRQACAGTRRRRRAHGVDSESAPNTNAGRRRMAAGIDGAVVYARAEMSLGCKGSSSII